MTKFAAKFTLLFLVFIIIFSSCKKKNKDNWTDTLTSGFIYIASDENFKTLTDAAIQAFEAHSKEAFISPIYTTEKQAIHLLAEDTVRFAIATRGLYSSEKALLAERNMTVRQHVIAFDGIAVIMNRENSDSIISIPALKKILTGKITEWSQLNSESRYGTIRTILDNKESGALRYVADSLLQGEKNSPNIYSQDSTLDVLERVAEFPNAIGIIGVNVLGDERSSTYLKYKDKIRIMRISKEDNATIENSYLPYPGDMAQDNYPLWRPVYVLISDPRIGLSTGFSQFLANEIGQKIIMQSGLLPISDPHVLKINVKRENPYK